MGQLHSNKDRNFYHAISSSCITDERCNQVALGTVWCTTSMSVMGHTTNYLVGKLGLGPALVNIITMPTIIGTSIALTYCLSKEYYKDRIFKKLADINDLIQLDIQNNRKPQKYHIACKNRLLTAIADRKTRREIKRLNKLNKAKDVTNTEYESNLVKLNNLYIKAASIEQTKYNKVVSMIARIPITIVVGAAKLIMKGLRSFCKMFMKKDNKSNSDTETVVSTT